MVGASFIPFIVTVNVVVADKNPSLTSNVMVTGPPNAFTGGVTVTFLVIPTPPPIKILTSGMIAG